MKFVLSIFLILATLISLGVLAYNDNLFFVGKGVATFISGFGNSVQNLLHVLGFTSETSYLVYTYLDNNNGRHGFVCSFSGRSSNALTVYAPTGYDDQVLSVLYSGPEPYTVNYNYVFIYPISSFVDGYLDNNRNELLFSRSDVKSSNLVFRKSYSDACEALDDWLIFQIVPQYINNN